MNSTGIFVIEPNDLDRRQVCDFVSSVSDLKLLGDSGQPGNDVLSARPDLLLINAGLLPSQLAALQRLTLKLPHVRCVFFHRKPNISTFLDALSLPICGLLSLNHLSTEEFVRSLRTISMGGAVIEPIAAQELLDHLRFTPSGVPAEPGELPLTQRETEVLTFVREGLANKEIATRLHISLGTVRAHLRTIFRKLDVSSRTGAAMVMSAAANEPLLRPV